MSTQHRGTPWHTCNDDDGNKYVSAQFQDICRLVNEGDVNANAAHIVKCVNGWDEQQAKIDELVASLSEQSRIHVLKRVIDIAMQNHDHESARKHAAELDGIEKRRKAALAKAREA